MTAMSKREELWADNVREYVRGGTPYNGLYGEAPSEMGTFFRLQVYKRVGISRAEVSERVGNLSFRYLKGPLIKIFRVDAPYNCII